QQTFPTAQAIIVRARFSGYRPDPNKGVLLVEVVQPPEDGEAAGVAETHIVKAAVDPEGDVEPPSAARGRDLADEWNGWRDCWPPGVSGDPILTMLHKGPVDSRGRLLTLRYQDAHAMLGSAEPVFLERAFLDGCFFGTPTVESLAMALTRLFAQLEERFYK